jgi:hypothetical protein
MILIAILAAITLLAVAGYWRWSRPSHTRHAPSRTARAPERFAAVEIRWRSGACEAARALEEQRFLASQAPALPLVGCTRTRCNCTFTKLSDRRTDDRRWGHEGLSAAMFLDEDRRNRAGRRDTD